MSIVTVRANQNDYDFSQTGGTRDPQFVLQDRVAFMDAVERQDATILNKTKKGSASSDRRPAWGIHAVNPRGSVLGAGLADNATSVTFPTGHSARFQQGHVLRITRKSDGEFEHIWVNDDPGNDTATVDRAIGGTTALTFLAGDEIKIIGIALPQGSDFPLAPVSTGYTWFNNWQFFGKALSLTLEADTTPSLENPNGSRADRQRLQIAKDIKLDLSETLLLGRRQNGDPSPAAPKPSMLGGILQMAEFSGNIYSVGGDDILLSPEALEFAQDNMANRVGSNAAKTYLMSFRTKQIFNRLMAPARYNRGIEGNNLDMNWDSMDTSVGRIEFTHIRDFPDGLILNYDQSAIRYIPRQGADWKEKDFPTKGFYEWFGIGGIYTLVAEKIPAMSIIRGFDTNLGHYPQWNRPSTFLV